MNHAKDKRPIKRVLLVEDDPTAKKGLTQVFEQLAYDVRAYEHPDAARIDLENENWRPDWALLDVFIPKDKHRELTVEGGEVVNTGIDLLRWMRSEKYRAAAGAVDQIGHRWIPIHIMTFSPDQNTLNLCWHAKPASVIDRYTNLEKRIKEELDREWYSVIDGTMAVDQCHVFYIHGGRQERLARTHSESRAYAKVLLLLAQRGADGCPAGDLESAFKEIRRGSKDRDLTRNAFHQFMHRLREAVNHKLAEREVKVPDGWKVVRYEQSDGKYYLQGLPPEDATGFSK